MLNNNFKFSPTTLGYIFIFIAALCWGFLGILGSVAMTAGVGPLEVAFWRAFLGGLFMLIHAFIIKDVYVRAKKDFLVFCLFGIFSIASLFISYQYAVLDGGVALSSVLLYTAPVWVALFSRIFFGLPLSKITCIGILIALVGVVCISFSQGSSVGIGKSLPMSGIFFGLLSGFLYATHYIVTKKYLTIYTPFTLYGYGSLVAAVCIFPLIKINLNLELSVWFSLLGIAFFSTYIAFWSYCEGIKLLLPTKAAVIANLEPVVATIAAYFIFGETFSLWGWFGALLILCTVFVLLAEDKKRVLS